MYGAACQQHTVHYSFTYIFHGKVYNFDFTFVGTAGEANIL